MKRWLVVIMLAAGAAPLAGCVVVPGPRPYAAAHWVPGHYGPYGGWVRGHWG
jgi:hypothetical protein